MRDSLIPAFPVSWEGALFGGLLWGNGAGHQFEPDLTAISSGLLCRVDRETHPALLHVPYERQYSEVAMMPLRMIRYMVGMWQAWLRDDDSVKLGSRLRCARPAPRRYPPPRRSRAESQGSGLDYLQPEAGRGAGKRTVAQRGSEPAAPVRRERFPASYDRSREAAESVGHPRRAGGHVRSWRASDSCCDATQ